MTLIRDGAQSARSNRPNDLGMNGFAAERLRDFGVDPYDFAAEQRARAATAGSPHRRARAVDSRPVTRELSFTYNDVTQRELLDQAALEADDGAMMLETWAPVRFVDSMKGTVTLKDAQQHRAQVEDRVGVSSKANEHHRGLTTINYDLVERAVEDYLARAVAQVAPQLSDMAGLAEDVGLVVKRQEEIRGAVALATSGNYAAANRRALAGGFNWNGGASAAPVADMQFCLAALRGRPSHAVFSLEAWQAAQANDELRAILASQLDNKGLLRAMDFGLYFGIPEVLVSESLYTALGSSTETRIYSTTAAAIVSATADPRRRSFMRTYRLRGGAGGFQTLSWFDPTTGRLGADWTKVSHASSVTIEDFTYGTIITGLRA